VESRSPQSGMGSGITHPGFYRASTNSAGSDHGGPGSTSAGVPVGKGGIHLTSAFSAGSNSTISGVKSGDSHILQTDLQTTAAQPSPMPSPSSGFFTSKPGNPAKSGILRSEMLE
jgi:hypothetical protein